MSTNKKYHIRLYLLSIKKTAIELGLKYEVINYVLLFLSVIPI